MQDWISDDLEENLEIRINIKQRKKISTHYQFQGNSGNPSGTYRINPLIKREGIIVLEEDWETSSAINPDNF